MMKRKGIEVGAIMIFLFIGIGMMLLGVIVLAQESTNLPDPLDPTLTVSVEDRLVQSSFNKASFQSLHVALFSTYNGTEIIELIAQSMHCDEHGMWNDPDSKCSNVPRSVELEDLISGRIELFDDPTYQLQVYDSFDADEDNSADLFLTAANGEFDDISGYSRIPIALYGDRTGYVLYRYEGANYQVILE